MLSSDVNECKPLPVGLHPRHADCKDPGGCVHPGFRRQPRERRGERHRPHPGADGGRRGVLVGVRRKGAPGAAAGG